MITVPFRGVLDSVVNLTACRIRFVFDGDYYYTMVDDITLSTMPDYDLALSDLSTNTTSGNLFAVRPGNARYIPESFLFGNDSTFDRMDLGAKIVNRGALDIPRTLNPRLHIAVDFEDASGNWIDNLYRDSMALDTIFTTDDPALYIDDFANIDFMRNNVAGPNSSAVGRYRVRYYHSMDSMDSNLFNDT